MEEKRFLEIGKQYVTRDGLRVVEITEIDERNYGARGKVMPEDDTDPFLNVEFWSIFTGRYRNYPNSTPYDLVATLEDWKLGRYK